MERLLLSYVAIAISAGSALTMLAISVLELNSYRSWVASITEGNKSSSGPRRFPVYLAIGKRMIILQMFPFLILGPFLPLILLSYLTVGDTTGSDDVFGIIAIIVALGIFMKYDVTRSIRRGSFIASEEGIEAVKIRRTRGSTIASIRWDQVTKVDMYDILPDGLGIDGLGKRIVVPYRSENLGPLFEIMRRRVPPGTIKEGAKEFIAIPDEIASRHPTQARGLGKNLIDGNRKLTYSWFIRGFFSFFFTVFCLLALYAYLYSPRSPNIPDIFPEIGFSALSLIFTLPLLEFFFSHFEVSEVGIERKAFWGRKTIISWEQVESVNYVSARRRSGYQVRGSGKMFELSSGLYGLSAFGRMVVAHVPPERWATAKREIINLIEHEQ